MQFSPENETFLFSGGLRSTKMFIDYQKLLVEILFVQWSWNELFAVQHILSLGEN